jgi:predicted aspartyl protease
MPNISGEIDEKTGAVVEVVVGIHGPREELLRKLEMSVPPPIKVRAQIDTGSGVTAIDPSILRCLDLRRVGTKSIITPSTGITPHNFAEYVVRVDLPNGGQHPTVLVIESEFHPDEGIKALLGRDLLASYTFSYDGPLKKFSVSF